MIAGDIGPQIGINAQFLDNFSGRNPMKLEMF